MVDQAEIHQRSLSKKVEDRIKAVQLFYAYFDVLLDKDAAWQDLIRLLTDEDDEVRLLSATSLGIRFFWVSDKESAWRDLHQLACNKNSRLRYGAVIAMGGAFSGIPDKETAWQDLIRLLTDEDHDVRIQVLVWMKSVSPYVLDRESSWQDLIRLTVNEDQEMRLIAVHILRDFFPHVPDKRLAWQDLHRLTSDVDRDVRAMAADTMGAAFPYISDKNAALQDLHQLSSDEDGSVRRWAANALCIAYHHVPNRDTAWQDLIRLTVDEDSDVRVSANHSLGRVLIFKATDTESEEALRRDLENALEYFERSVEEAEYYNPAKFCLPFYRSFYVLTCKSESSEVEVEKYLREAKEASKGSKIKEDLLEAVETLSNALKETHGLQEKSLYEVKRDLKVYSQYCNHFAELLDKTEDKAPGAVKLLRIGGRRVDNQIKKTIGEIQEIAKELCQMTVGTDVESLGREVNQKAREISIENYLRSEKSILRIAEILDDLCDLLPPQKREHACELVEEIEKCCNLEDRIIRLETAINYIQPKIDIERYGKQFEYIKYELDEIKLGIKELQQKILNRLDENEKAIITTILDQSDQAQIDNMLDLVKQVLSAIQHQELQGPVTSGDVEHLSKVVDDTRLKAVDKLKITLPLIPYLLQYEHEITLEKGVNLSAAWNRLVGRSKKGK